MPDEPLVYPLIRHRVALLAVVALLAIIACLIAIEHALAGRGGGKMFQLACGALPVLVFAGASLIRQLLSNHPVLVADDDGIHMGCGTLSIPFIAWEEIDAIGIFRARTQRYVAIRARDLDAILARQPLLQRLFFGISRHITPTPMTIPEVAFDEDVDLVLRRLRGRLERAREHLSA